MHKHTVICDICEQPVKPNPADRRGLGACFVVHLESPLSDDGEGAGFLDAEIHVCSQPCLAVLFGPDRARKVLAEREPYQRRKSRALPNP